MREQDPVTVWVPGVAEKITPRAEEELRAYLDEAHSRAAESNYPTLAELYIESSRRNLSIGVGDPSHSVAVWTDFETSFVSIAPGASATSPPSGDDDDFGFWFADSWSEFSAGQAIGRDVAWDLAAHFWRSGGDRPDSVDWEAV